MACDKWFGKPLPSEPDQICSSTGLSHKTLLGKSLQWLHGNDDVNADWLSLLPSLPPSLGALSALLNLSIPPFHHPLKRHDDDNMCPLRTKYITRAKPSLMFFLLRLEKAGTNQSLTCWLALFSLPSGYSCQEKEASVAYAAQPMAALLHFLVSLNLGTSTLRFGHEYA